jgi:DNA polymerase-3 subunit delta'
VPILPLIGHEALRARLLSAIERNALPASLLLHGPRGVGKQRLALWLGAVLLCTAEGERPCGKCVACRYAGDLVHPDLHWYFPRTRPKESESSVDDVREDIAEARAARAKEHGLYAPPPGSEAIYVSTVRAIVNTAAMSPALGRRKVFIIGDAERMVAQEGADQAANAFLKLLEEPPADTTIVLTTSEPGALLPTIRSRVVSVRVPRLRDHELRAWLEQPGVANQLASAGAPSGTERRVELAEGAPGALIAAGGSNKAFERARRLLDAARAEPAQRYRVAYAQGTAGARGDFATALDALTVLLRDSTKAAIERRDDVAAMRAAKAVDVVERAKQMADGNANPQLVSAALLRELASALA